MTVSLAHHVGGAGAGGATAVGSDGQQRMQRPSWLNFENQGALVGPRGYEGSPMWLGGRLYVMQMMMGRFAPDGGDHSYFCIFDGASGEKVACPSSSSGYAFCSGMVSTLVDGREDAYVFCSAWDRSNHTVTKACPTPDTGGGDPNVRGWGCGGCSRPDGCSIGAWRSADMVRWAGPAAAIGPSQFHNSTGCIRYRTDWRKPNSTGCIPPTNTAVGTVPATAAVVSGLPKHQAFMAFELSYTIAINTGSDGDLTKNWVMLDGVAYGGQHLECPAVRYREADGYYYLLGDNEGVGASSRPSLRDSGKIVYLIATMPGRHSGDQVHKVKKNAAPLL